MNNDDFARFNTRNMLIFWELLKGAERRLTEIPQAHKNADLAMQAKHAEQAAKCLREAAGHLKAYQEGGRFIEYLPRHPDDLESSAIELDAIASALSGQAGLSRKDNQAPIKEAIRALAFAYWHGMGTVPGFSRKAAESAGQEQTIVRNSFTDFLVTFFDEATTKATLGQFAALVEKTLRAINDDLPPIDEPQTHQPLFSYPPDE